LFEERFMRCFHLGIGLAVFAGLLAAYARPDSTGAPPRKAEDVTGLNPKELAMTWVVEARDPKTGFVVGGKNQTALIRALPSIAGRTIAALEKDMRPGQFSTVGFLGKEEKLLDILVEDNKLVVDELGLTHQALARPLRFLGALAARRANGEAREFFFHGRRLKLLGKCYRGFVESPFEDGTKANCEATVWNLDNGKKVSFSLLVPDMIERYGFYEGHGTTYRVEPRVALEVLDFLAPKKRP
jgi:hypothetical protein